MKVFISRTSRWGKQPCDEAVLVSVDAWDSRTFKTVEEHDARLRESWMARGTHHGVNATGIYRKVGQQDKWVIEVESIEALLLKLNERVIVDFLDELDGRSNPDVAFNVEIYDEYKE